MPLDQEFRWQHQNGRWLWLHCRAARVTAPDGSERLEGICTDVTTRKSLEEQLSRSQKIEAIGQLTAGIAHDFNNLLSVILAGAEHLESRLGGEDKQVSQEICDATLRGVELTSRLLGFARKRARSSRATDLNVVLEELTPMLARAAGRDVTLSVVPFVGLGAICADRGELEQILMNLAINARDAMPRGGQLTVETLNVDVSLAEARENGKPGAGKHVAIRVSDTGSGMDQDTLSHLFEPFFTTKAEKGTGLGLSTSYGIVRRHGGHIVVESSLGKGTMFTVYFPRLTDAQRDRATSACA
jgi:signal transduction histidine kinase